MRFHIRRDQLLDLLLRQWLGGLLGPVVVSVTDQSGSGNAGAAQRHEQRMNAMINAGVWR
jgi:hypothetical protein